MNEHSCVHFLELFILALWDVKCRKDARAIQEASSISWQITFACLRRNLQYLFHIFLCRYMGDLHIGCQTLDHCQLSLSSCYKNAFLCSITGPSRIVVNINSFQNVSFRYSENTPLIYKNLEFGIDLDTRLALVGPNGAGKSTLLKLIYGEVKFGQTSVILIVLISLYLIVLTLG